MLLAELYSGHSMTQLILPCERGCSHTLGSTIEERPIQKLMNFDIFSRIWKGDIFTFLLAKSKQFELQKSTWSRSQENLMQFQNLSQFFKIASEMVDLCWYKGGYILITKIVYILYIHYMHSKVLKSSQNNCHISVISIYRQGLIVKKSAIKTQ